MRNIARIGIAVLLGWCTGLVLAQERKDTVPAAKPRKLATERSAPVQDEVQRAARKTAKDGLDSTVVSEVFESIVITPGRNVPLDSTMDYSTVSTVAVTVQCSGCTSAATSLGTCGLVLQARWTVPNAELVVATENKPASAFPYWDAGGAVFNVYGPQFRLVLQNTGSQPISLQQVTLFRRSQ